MHTVYLLCQRSWLHAFIVGGLYGGVAFMWRKNISQVTSVVGADDYGRCLCITVNLRPMLQLFSVYFPCADSSVAYETELYSNSNCVKFFENNITRNCPVVVIGDMNFECSAISRGFSVCNSILSGYDIANCDDLLQCDDSNNKYTSYNDCLGHYSFIDHVFESNCVRVALFRRDLLLTQDLT
jgi:hypothetical protein